MRLPRFPSLKDCAVSVAVTLGLLAIGEAALRVLAPQVSSTDTQGGPARAIPDTEKGHRYRPLARALHRTPEFAVEYAIDAHGRRARDDHFEPDSAATRVLVVGDSFTFGDASAEKDTWVRVTERTLRARRRNVECINAGIEAYNTRDELLYLRELVPILAPDVVVVGFAANDVYSNSPTQAPASAAPDARRDGRAALHVVALAKRALLRSDAFYLRAFRMSSRRVFYARSPNPEASRQFEVTLELFARMHALCQEHGIPLVVISIPQQFSVLADAHDFKLDEFDPARMDGFLGQAASGSGLVWVPTLPALADAYRRTGVAMFHRVDGHFSAAGNRIVAEVAAQALEDVIGTRAGAGR